MARPFSRPPTRSRAALAESESGGAPMAYMVKAGAKKPKTDEPRLVAAAPGDMHRYNAARDLHGPSLSTGAPDRPGRPLRRF
jgi:hypothetical protein